MADYLKVNWNHLKKMSDNTLKNASDFEASRLKFQEIVNSLGECWTGIDSDSYVKNCNGFLNKLKDDSMYFEALGQYFDKGSKVYSGVVTKHSENVKKINDLLEEDKKKYMLYDDNNIGGGINV